MRCGDTKRENERTIEERNDVSTNIKNGYQTPTDLVDGHLPNLLQHQLHEQQARDEIRGVEHVEHVVPVVGVRANVPHQERPDRRPDAPRAVDDSRHRGERPSVPF